jgi:hypothetical protein
MANPFADTGDQTAVSLAPGVPAVDASFTTPDVQNPPQSAVAEAVMWRIPKAPRGSEGIDATPTFTAQSRRRVMPAAVKPEE